MAKTWRQQLRLLVPLLLVCLGATLPAPAAASAPPTPPLRDWSDVVDFTNTGGLNRYDPADAALLQMTAPERIKDPAKRVRFQRQLDSLQARQRQLKAAGASATTITSVAAPEAVATIDPGCQLTSSTPGGYDLCAYDATGDTMSAWPPPSGRKQVMWAGLQEADTTGQWRVWAKSQAYGQTSSNVNHYLDLKQVEAWERSEPNGNPTTLLGTGNPPLSAACAPCYEVGTTWRGQHSAKSFATSFVRDWVEIQGTNDKTTTDNGWCSGWWYRSAGVSYGPGPHGQTWSCGTIH